MLKFKTFEGVLKGFEFELNVCTGNGNGKGIYISMQALIFHHAKLSKGLVGLVNYSAAGWKVEAPLLYV